MLKFSMEFSPPIPDAKTLIIGTLGPSGTSSHYASSYIVKQLESEQLTGKIQLFDSFPDVKTALLQDQVDLALVPHAYALINEFYMEPSFDLGFIFIYPTPVYGLAKKKNTEVVFKGARIVTHPAPLPLLSRLLPDSQDQSEMQVDFSLSTSDAAIQVQQGLATLAITNENAVAAYDLEFISTYGKIPMSWSIFYKKIAQSHV
ncbi:LysR family transcriptional regulator [Nodularia sphaerocarpa]|uniref:LysR family transcriptional regulator n=1 Tax=Nodularia sphaerocarpa TaxID=137816 RepID=UPI001EFB42CE|nr:LysR family transcriptional regulator [Nodularia sphaerocarpa]MDB9373591.1 LysR family transcriptional regulator [Nodularia sphaerocarpa CS-585]MDB9378024.1 LysR family transcriptional regulator [Nodularia sphaerocarpa CS-585A2]ULP74379.1 prephenate decarboxylase [Nodularia sphaerocarpa UHCC 0038]